MVQRGTGRVGPDAVGCLEGSGELRGLGGLRVTLPFRALPSMNEEAVGAIPGATKISDI